MIEIDLRPDGYGIPRSPPPSYVVGIRVAGEYLLHPLEVLYLVLQNEAIVITEYEELDDFRRVLQEVLKRVKETCTKEGRGCYLANAFWSMFTTYYSLRRKGRKILPEGRKEGTIIEIRKGKWWAEYLVLEEGVKIPLRKLLNWIEDARANDLKAIIAIVDRNGSVTYYEASKVEIKGAGRTREEEVQVARASSPQKGTER